MRALDLPPEYLRYRDEGCELASSCLQCPFPHCRFDQEEGQRREARGARDRQVLALHRREGLGPRELAQRFGLSTRTIHRIIRRERYEP